MVLGLGSARDGYGMEGSGWRLEVSILGEEVAATL